MLSEESGRSAALPPSGLPPKAVEPLATNVGLPSNVPARLNVAPALTLMPLAKSVPAPASVLPAARLNERPAPETRSVMVGPSVRFGPSGPLLERERSELVRSNVPPLQWKFSGCPLVFNEPAAIEPPERF